MLFIHDTLRRSLRGFPKIAFVIAMCIVGVPAAIQYTINNSANVAYAEDDSPDPADRVELKSSLTNTAGMRLIKIPPGEFIMGLPDVNNDHEVPEESPAHRVVISKAFWMGMTEVTQEQYARVMGTNPSWQVTHERAGSPKVPLDPDESIVFESFPVESVSWFDAVAFCAELTKLERAAGYTRRYRLPTEAEWEYACRSGNTDAYVYSRSIPPDDKTGDNVRKYPRHHDLTEVSSFLPNAFGIYDMRGNVFEWCADWFAKDYYAVSPVRDPQGPEHGFLKVVRGGDWRFVGEDCKLGVDPATPWNMSRYIGFRVVCEEE